MHQNCSRRRRLSICKLVLDVLHMYVSKNDSVYASMTVDVIPYLLLIVDDHQKSPIRSNLIIFPNWDALIFISLLFVPFDLWGPVVPGSLIWSSRVNIKVRWKIRNYMYVEYVYCNTNPCLFWLLLTAFFRQLKLKRKHGFANTSVQCAVCSVQYTSHFSFSLCSWETWSQFIIFIITNNLQKQARISNQHCCFADPCLFWLLLLLYSPTPDISLCSLETWSSQQQSIALAKYL
jgi:hypothetical protein